MEVIKWIVSTLIAIIVVLAGAAIAIGTWLIGMVMSTLGLIAYLVAGLTVVIKEKIEENKRDRDN